MSNDNLVPVADVRDTWKRMAQSLRMLADSPTEKLPGGWVSLCYPLRWLADQVESFGPSMRMPNAPRRLKDSAVRELVGLGNVEPISGFTLEHVAVLHRHIGNLAREVLRLRQELRHAYANNAERNRQLDALMWGWCGDQCEYGSHTMPHRLPLTELVVQTVEESARKLRHRWARLVQFRASKAESLCERCNKLVVSPRHDCVAG